MRFLKKVLTAVFLIILLAVLKIIFAKLFPASSLFHYNLVSSLQLFLLCWAVVTGLLEIYFQKKLNSGKNRIVSFILFLILIGSCELVCFFGLYNPEYIPKKLLPYFSYYYNNYQRDILQYNKTISMYDSSVFYKMKPDNKSVFKNIEFSDSIYTNGKGFRDNENSLQYKKIICLGDSYTLGWGVHQQETYPHLLANNLKVTVLNTGMSSYGTAREIESVRNLDMTGVENIIIQYSYNDEEENEDYVIHNDHLQVSQKAVFDSAGKALAWSNFYFPGKYFFTISKLFLKNKLDNLKESLNKKKQTTVENDTVHYNEMAQSFIEVIKKSGWDFDKVHVFVFDICEYQSMNDKFIQALENELTVQANSLFFKNHIHPVHIVSLLQLSDYYLLDWHIKASGQKKIADKLTEEILQQKKKL
jgi:hypothetical protein